MNAKKINMKHDKGTFSHSDNKRFRAAVSGPFKTSGVFFQCPIINCLDILPQEEWPAKIEKFIEEEMKDDPRLQSILLIKNCNPNQSKVKICIELLIFYIENIIKYQDVEMYREIRLSSQIVKENVLPIKGAIEFLESIGFTKKKLLMEDHEEEFLVLEDSMDDLALLENSINDLKSVKRIELVLDRNVQVLLPSNAEIKMDHQKGAEELENQIVLKIQNMEIEKQNSSNTNYKYCLIRIKFPDYLILQGIFDVNERLSNLLDFIKESLFNENLPFKLKLVDGRTIGYADKNMTLSELNLVPTAFLLFIIDPLYTKKNQKYPYLKTELLLLV